MCVERNDAFSEIFNRAMRSATRSGIGSEVLRHGLIQVTAVTCMRISAAMLL